MVHSVRSPSGLPVTRVFARIDGQYVEGAETKGFVPVRADAETRGQLRFPVPAKDFTLSLIAETARSASQPATVKLDWGLREEDLRKPVLYALVVGGQRLSRRRHHRSALGR